MNDASNTSYGSGLEQRFPQGTPVYDVNGDKVGTVAGIGGQSNELIIQKGLFFPKDIPVPMTAIGRSDADGIYLNLTKDDVTNGNWNASNTAGYTGSVETPYRANAAQSVGDAPLSAGQPGAYQQGYQDQPATYQNQGAAYQSQTAQPQNDVTVPVREEQLVADKQQAQTGQVRIRKDVVEEPQNITIPVRHEEVTVERVPVEGQPASDVTDGSDAFTERAVDVPLMGEQVVVGKQTRVGEEVRLHKQTVTDQQQVGDTVRKERIRVEGADETGYQDDGGDLDTTADTSALNP